MSILSLPTSIWWRLFEKNNDVADKLVFNTKFTGWADIFKYPTFSNTAALNAKTYCANKIGIC
jgi:hypothetical protein